jgi:molecular chaperone DnaK
MRIGEALYKAQQAGGGPGADGPQQPGGQGGSGAAGDDKVVDADFEEVDEQKKRGSA